MIRKTSIPLTIDHLSTVVRHGVISALCAVTDFLIFYVSFNIFNFNINFSFVIAVFFAAIIAFLGHTFFTFKVNKVVFRNIIYFIIQLSISFIIGFSAFNIFLCFEISPEMSKIFQLFCTFGFNILFGKFISFRKSIKNL
jgi:putative flippase GtrA